MSSDKTMCIHVYFLVTGVTVTSSVREDGMFLSVDPDRMASLEARSQLIWICRLLSKKDKQIQAQQGSDQPLKRQSRLQQTTNFSTSFSIFRKK